MITLILAVCALVAFLLGAFGYTLKFGRGEPSTSVNWDQLGKAFVVAAWLASNYR